jgi:hypothetical protein
MAVLLCSYAAAAQQPFLVARRARPLRPEHGRIAGGAVFIFDELR